MWNKIFNVQFDIYESVYSINPYHNSIHICEYHYFYYRNGEILSLNFKVVFKV